ncbi:MAG: PQQ-binding-like beta-propeller repeat protein [Deltaproteobacteria bacterium]|nr:PQQ-binding-like beta-propeller repeat protein [Deltaproteobacteria bacterium]
MIGVIYYILGCLSNLFAGSITAQMVKPYDYAIMQMENRIDVFIRNTSTDPRDIISQIRFTFPNGYVITHGSALNWEVQSIANPRITFRASSCSYVLNPGGSLVFSIYVIPPASNSDVVDTVPEILAANGSGLAGCLNYSRSRLTNIPSYTRHSLYVQIDASPLTVNIGKEIEILYTVTNRTNSTVNNIIPTIQKLSPDGADCILSAPSPTSLNLPSNGTGYIKYTCNASRSGSIRFSGYVSSGTGITSPSVLSPNVSIGNFTSVLSVVPNSIVSGDDVDVYMTVTNWGSTTITGIYPTSQCPSSPGGLCFIGSAVSSYITGPNPPIVSQLLPGQSTSFVWNYVITGYVGNTFAYSGFAVADGGIHTNVSQSESGQISSYSIGVSPTSVLRNSTNKTVVWRIKNSSSVGIRTVTIYNPETNIWVKANQSGASCKGCTWSYSRLNNPERYQFSTTNTNCYIYQNEECDFPLLFSQVGNSTQPPSTTNYVFETRITDAKGVTSRFYNDLTVVVSNPPSDVNSLVTVSGNNRIKIIWSNPPDHYGTLILKTVGNSSSCIPPDTRPSDGIQYSINQVIGNATVVYSDSGGSTTDTFTDTSVINGTMYCYKVYNLNEYFVYSSGNVPSSNGVKGQPTNGSEPNPIWVYSVGVSSLFTPAVYPGSNIYTSSNLGAINSLNPLNGDEYFRPVSLGGAINNRFSVVPLEDGTKMILTGAQNGYAYGIYADTGTVRWSIQLTTTGMITAPPAVILRKYANSAYQTRYSTDLVFFATRNADRVSNKIFAINPNNGSIVWVFNQNGNHLVDIFTAAPTVDYSNNWLYAASYSGASQNQNSLWILDIINSGALLYSANYGDIDFGVALSHNRTVANFASKTTGLVYSINSGDKSLRWSYNPNLGTNVNYSYLLPLPDGLVFTVSSHLIRIIDNGNNASTLYDVTIAGVTPPLVSVVWNKLFVGSNTGTLYQINLSNGSIEYTRSVGNAIGYMSADTTLKNIYFGTTDGRVFAYRVPFTQ